MDIRNFCQKIDVDSIRAKFPQMPAMPAMPPIKLPKSMSKLKSRKIFKSSREDVNTQSPKLQLQQQHHLQQQQQQHQQMMAPPTQHSDFIKHTPTRISTISSLMDQGGGAGGASGGGGGEYNHNTYRSACSIEDDYPSPRQFDRFATRTISPTQTPINSMASPCRNGAAAGNSKLTLTEKLQKGYKDISEFRFKHIFAKKTVVRKDTIVVDGYVKSFAEDRIREEREQERRDRKIANNYRFDFRESRQKSGRSDSISSCDSPAGRNKSGVGVSRQAGRSVSEQSGDESGMETSPPKRPPGIAATRFAKLRNPPLQQDWSDEEDSGGREQQIEQTKDGSKAAKSNSSTLWSIKENRTSVEASPLPTSMTSTGTASKKSYKERMRRMASLGSSYESADDSMGDGPSGSAKVLAKLRNIGGKRNSEPDLEQQSDESEKKRKAPVAPPSRKDNPAGEKPMATIRQNIKRIHKSIKRPSTAGPAVPSEEEDEEPSTSTRHNINSPSKTEKLAARLRKFQSHDDIPQVSSAKKTDDETASKSPIRAAISNKLQSWKKSFKRKPDEGPTKAHSNDESSPEKDKRPDSLINKLRYIRSRKNPNSTEELDEVGQDYNGGPSSEQHKEDATRKPSNLEEKFEHARQRTMKKVNEKMQQIKLFHKSQEHVNAEQRKKQEAQSDDDEPDKSNDPVVLRRGNRCNYQPTSDDDDEDDIEAIHHQCASQHARAAWTTRSLLSESVESDTDCEFPRVLIHQDNSDAFESTLIIAVTRAGSSRANSPTPIITEIPAEITRASPPSPPAKPLEWVSNNDVISGFLQITPPTKRTLSEVVVPRPPRHHRRALSIDSNSDSDSWIPEKVSSSRTSTAGRDSLEDKEQPWKVHNIHSDERLYKAKSIDIFERNTHKGGTTAVFEDFDDELKDEPVVKISADANGDSFEKDSSEDPDAPDDDNSSRITKILANHRDAASPTLATSQIAVVEPAAKLLTTQDSLSTNFAESEEIYCDEQDNDSADDRPPSLTPSPPPSISPPPPPLPHRKSSALISRSAEYLPALPKSKPPPPSGPQTQPPPVIPERTPSMRRISKPLVKTSSLRLAYNEQVKPADVGKVNKLISRFEQPNPQAVQRPVIIPRNIQHYESEEYSEDEAMEDDDDDNDLNDDRENTPTATPTSSSILISNEINETTIVKRLPSTRRSTFDDAFDDTQISNGNDPQSTREAKAYNMSIPKFTLNMDLNSNCSLPSSEYGSPLEYPSSLLGSTETTPIPDRRQASLDIVRNSSSNSTGRSRRSMTRDDEKFLSFDSDEENSYYSISSTGSSRYVVEI